MLQTVSRAKDFIDLLKDKTTVWNHVIARQKKKHDKALEFAEQRQVVRRYSEDLKKKIKAMENIKEIADVKLELGLLYNNLFHAFKSSKK